MDFEEYSTLIVPEKIMHYWKRGSSLGIPYKSRTPEYQKALRQLRKVNGNLPNYNIKYNEKNRIIVFDHFGNKCICCGETNPQFLTLSHKNNDGSKERNETGKYKGGTSYYNFLIKNNFQTKYELILECYNCNLGRTRNKGICPHKIEA
jgi:hypothetical protein